MGEPERIPLRMVAYKYVPCVRVGREVRLTLGYGKAFAGREGRKVLTDCDGSLECGARTVKGGVVGWDFSACHFGKVSFCG